LLHTQDPSHSLVSVGNASELINNKLRTHVLHIGIIRVREMLRIDAFTIVGANAITLHLKSQYTEFFASGTCKERKTYGSANIQSLRDETRRNAVGAVVLRDTVEVASGGAAIAVDIARQTGLVQGVTDEEDTLDSSALSAGKLDQRIDSCSGALRVSLKDEALVRVALEAALDVVDDVCGSLRRVLVGAGWVDGVVDCTAGDLGHDVLVHGDEAGGGALLLAGTSGIDDGWIMGSAWEGKWY
jgi:hypothetical protein